jgi:hypothetical protein
MPTNSHTAADATIPQGDPRLLTTEGALALLHSTIPARLAYVALDRTPRIVPTWFSWTGHELVMGTFVSAPHVTEPASRPRSLRANPAVAVAIDTNEFPPHALSLRGNAVVSEHDGVVAEYADAARRYLGAEASAEYLAMLDDPATVMARIAVKPTWVGLIDFHTRMPRPLGGVGPASTENIDA